MNGMQKLNIDEMKAIKGGAGLDTRYIFFCPSNKDKFQANVDKYLQQSQEKANAYVKYVYENCTL